MKNAKEGYMYALGAVLVISFFIILAFLIFREIPESNNEVLYLAIGALIGFVGSVVSYFFGSSKGSSDKNELIHKK